MPNRTTGRGKRHLHGEISRDGEKWLDMIWSEAFHSDKDFELELDGSGLVEDGSINPGSITPGSFVPPSDDYFDVTSPAGEVGKETGVTMEQGSENHLKMSSDGDRFDFAHAGAGGANLDIEGNSGNTTDSKVALSTFSGSGTTASDLTNDASRSVISRLTLPGGDKFSLLLPLSEDDTNATTSPYTYTSSGESQRHPGMDALNAWLQAHVPDYNPSGQMSPGTPPTTTTTEETFDWSDANETGLVGKEMGMAVNSGFNPYFILNSSPVDLSPPFGGVTQIFQIGLLRILPVSNRGSLEHIVGFDFDTSVMNSDDRSIILRVNTPTEGSWAGIVRLSEADIQSEEVDTFGNPVFSYSYHLTNGTAADQTFIEAGNFLAGLTGFAGMTFDLALVENIAGWRNHGNNVVRDVVTPVAAVGTREEFDWSDLSNQVGVINSQRGAIPGRQANRSISYNPSDPNALLIAHDANPRVVLGGPLRQGIAALSTAHSFIVRLSIYTAGSDSYSDDYALVFPLDAATLSAPNSQGEVTFSFDGGGAMRSWITALTDAQWNSVRVSWAIVEDSAGWVNDEANIARWVIVGGNDWSGISPATLDVAVVENSAGWRQDDNGTVRLPASVTPPVIVEPTIVPTPDYYWNETNPEGELTRVTGVALTQHPLVTDQTALLNYNVQIPGFANPPQGFTIDGTYENPGGGVAPFSSGGIALSNGMNIAHPEDLALVVRVTLTGGEQFSGLFYFGDNKRAGGHHYFVQVSGGALLNDSQRALAELIKFLPPYQATTTATLDLAVVRADAGWKWIGNQVVRLKDNIPNAPYIAIERSPANFPPNFLNDRLWLTEHASFDDDGNYTPAPEIKFPGKVVWEGVGWMQNQTASNRTNLTDQGVSGGGLPDSIPTGMFGSRATALDYYSGIRANNFQRLRTIGAADSRGGVQIYNMNWPLPVQTRFAFCSKYSVFVHSGGDWTELRDAVWRSFVVLTRDVDLHDPYNFFPQTGAGQGPIWELQDLLWYIENPGPGYTTATNRGFPALFSGQNTNSLIVKHDLQLVQMWDLYQLIDTGKLKNGSMYEKIEVETEGTGHYYRLSLNNRANSNSSINDGVIKYKFGR